MKSLSFAALVGLLVVSACAITQPTDSVEGGGWHQTTTGRTHRQPGAPLEPTEEPAAAQAVHVGRLRFVSASYRAASVSTVRAATAAPTLAMVTGTANAAELIKADSLLTALVVLNRAADTTQETQERAEITEAKTRRARDLHRTAFAFRPTNLKRNDTIFIDTLGVRLAFWIGTSGVRLKVAKGILNKERNGETLDVSVRPGFDWQPYRIALLLFGGIAAISIIVGISSAVFQPRRNRRNA